MTEQPNPSPAEEPETRDDLSGEAAENDLRPARRVVVAEDETLIRLDIVEMLQDGLAGIKALAAAGGLGEALQAVFDVLRKAQSQHSGILHLLYMYSMTFTHDRGLSRLPG